ncbi:MAG: ATP-binding protein [Azovibrio sp.]|uniref:hybrid sensor histidine kinase/response regulator n=1 Tax=Azovibrio sp. TaxID=1872673 RepID=UPI003C725352
MSETPTSLREAELLASVARLNQELEHTRAQLQEARGANDSITAALSRSEERLRLITDTIPAQISYFDKNQIYRYANRGYSDWFGLPESEVIGSPIAKVIGEKGYNSVKHYIARALSGETITHEYSMRQKGKRVNARSTMVPEMGPDGVPVGCFVFSFDITEVKRMQAALAQAQKMEAIGQLTGGVAHDFNNLLTIIIGNLSTLKERNPGRNETAELAEPALQAARRGAQLVRSLLSFSRQQPLKPVAVNVGELVADLETLIRRSLPASIQFSTRLPAHPLYSRVDPGQLESALLNFALNARDAMPEGGRLVMRVRPGVLDETRAEEHQLPAGPYVLIEVSDTGCGMDEATRSKVFEPFFTTKGFGQGSGLGLSMVYGFARQSGGCVSVSSKPGKGSTFTLLLPPAPPGSLEEALPEEQAPATAAPGALVLLVEDEPDVRRVVRNLLLDLGYPVLEAENGNQAAEILSQVQDITVLLTDIIMPGGMNGRELARLAQQERPELHVVLMSGYEEQAALSQADPSHLRLLGKPFSKRELARALQS